MPIVLDPKKIAEAQRFPGVVVASYEETTEYGDQWVQVIYNRKTDSFQIDRAKVVQPDSRGYNASSLAARLEAWGELKVVAADIADYIGHEAIYQMVTKKFNGTSYSKPIPQQRVGRVGSTELAALQSRWAAEQAARKNPGAAATAAVPAESEALLLEVYAGNTDAEAQARAARVLPTDLANQVYTGQAARTLIDKGVLTYDPDSDRYVAV